MLNKQEAAIRLQHSLDLGKCSLRVRDAAKCPCHDGSVEAPVVKWEVLRGSTEQLNRERHATELRTGHAEKFRRRIDTSQAGNCSREERQIQPGAYSDFEYRSGRFGNKFRSPGRDLFVAHRHVDEPWEDELLIKAHDVPPHRLAAIKCWRLLRSAFRASDGPRSSRQMDRPIRVRWQNFLNAFS
jgi:hypothetical protein